MYRDAGLSLKTASPAPYGDATQTAIFCHIGALRRVAIQKISTSPVGAARSVCVDCWMYSRASSALAPSTISLNS